jgi:hypothetical protein
MLAPSFVFGILQRRFSSALHDDMKCVEFYG